MKISFRAVKLPSKGEVLRRLCFLSQHHAQSELLVIAEVSTLWQKCQIPVAKDYNVMKRLKKLVAKYNRLRRQYPKNSKVDETSFIKQRNDLFDVSHGDALQTCSAEVRNFLISQRKAGREGFITDLSFLGVYNTEVKMNRTMKSNKKRKSEDKDLSFSETTSAVPINDSEFNASENDEDVDDKT